MWANDDHFRDVVSREGKKSDSNHFFQVSNFKFEGEGREEGGKQ